jgi:hypothetical protein
MVNPEKIPFMKNKAAVELPPLAPIITHQLSGQKQLTPKTAEPF